jgi:hypothetical protein
MRQQPQVSAELFALRHKQKEKMRGFPVKGLKWHSFGTASKNDNDVFGGLQLGVRQGDSITDSRTAKFFTFPEDSYKLFPVDAHVAFDNFGSQLFEHFPL